MDMVSYLLGKNSGGSITKIKPYALNFRDENITEKIDLSDIIDGSELNSFYIRDMSKLTTINLKNIKFNKLESMQYFCYNLPLLENIDLTHTEFPKGKQLNYAFTNCAKIKRIDLSGITGPVNNLYSFCNGCTALEYIDISGIDLTAEIYSTMSMFSGVSYGCEVIVRDEGSKTWFNTNFPNYTNVKVKS